VIHFRLKEAVLNSDPVLIAVRIYLAISFPARSVPYLFDWVITIFIIKMFLWGLLAATVSPVALDFFIMLFFIFILIPILIKKINKVKP